MKRYTPLVVILALFSLASGYLMSRASWIGRVGMTFFYKEYNLLKIWWQGAVAVFLVFLFLLGIHSWLWRSLRGARARIAYLVLFLAAAGGAYLTYDDFHTDLSHRLLGHRFHYGFYLIWAGWLIISITFLFSRSRPAIGQDNMEQAAH